MKTRAIDAIHSKLLDRIEILGAVSAEEDRLTRLSLSREMETASLLIKSWMSSAGLVATIDPLQNVIGSWPNAHATKPALHLGSHYDTVVNAGKYDGVLGLLLNIAAIEILQIEGYTPQRHINAIGFCDEEGARFQTTFLGSSHLCGDLDPSVLEKRDAQGITVRDAMQARDLDPEKLSAITPLIKANDLYLEAHIEQGPALEALDLPLGIVTGIAAQSRIQVSVSGKTGHAGTVPPDLRRDALAAAAEMILEIEKLPVDAPEARATVGQLHLQPNVSNAIPSQVDFTIDLRHPKFDTLKKLRDALRTQLRVIAAKRQLNLQIEYLQESTEARCDRKAKALIARSVSKIQKRAPELLSGAGHDALKIAQTCPIGMLFIRCQDGLSHHPEEHVSPEDIRDALEAWIETIKTIDSEW